MTIQMVCDKCGAKVTRDTYYVTVESIGPKGYSSKHFCPGCFEKLVKQGMMKYTTQETKQ